MRMFASLGFVLFWVWGPWWCFETGVPVSTPSCEKIVKGVRCFRLKHGGFGCRSSRVQVQACLSRDLLKTWARAFQQLGYTSRRLSLGPSISTQIPQSSSHLISGYIHPGLNSEPQPQTPSRVGNCGLRARQKK